MKKKVIIYLNKPHCLGNNARGTFSGRRYLNEKRFIDHMVTITA